MADDRSQAIREALDGAGINGKPEWLEGDKVAGRAKAAVKRGAPLVIAGGGDGTVSAAAGALAGSKAALGILPLGTLNHFARDLGMSTDLAEAAAQIAGGRARAVDVGELNGRVFVNNSAIGLYPLMVRDREAQQERLGRGKRLAMAVAAARTMFRFSSQRLTLTINQEKTSVDTRLLFVGNNAYRTQLPGAGTRERLDGGELFVLVMRPKSRLGFFLAACRSLAGRPGDDDLVMLEKVESLRVGSKRSTLTVSVDGETVHLKPPLEYRIRKRALKVVAPASPPKRRPRA